MRLTLTDLPERISNITARKMGFYQLPLRNMRAQEITQEAAQTMHRRTWKHKWDDRTRIKVIFCDRSPVGLFFTELVEASNG
jgi:hypothetical protein